MELLVTVVALLLGTIIVGHEYLRTEKRSQFDFLMGASTIYFVCYCIIPIYIQSLEDTDLHFWNWIFRLSFSRGEYLLASLLTLIGYLSILAGYYATSYTRLNKRFRYQSEQKNSSLVIPRSIHVTLAIGFALIGLGSLAIYVNEIGGLEVLVRAVGLFRNQKEAYSNFGFLIKVAPFTSISSYLFWDLFATSKWGVHKTLYGLGFSLTFLSAVLGLYGIGGRVQFVFYLFSFVLYASFRRGKIPLLHLLGGGSLFVIVMLFGKELINLNVYVTDDLIGDAWEEISTDPFAGLRKILLEFVFPFVSLANVVQLVPNELGYRWFFDLPLGIAYLLPKPLLGLTLPPTVSMVHEESINAPIPIDLLSFGYTSIGVMGPLLVSMLYGMVLSLADSYFPAQGNRTLVLLRAAWLLYLSQQVMYGNPQHAAVAGFPLIIGTFVIVFSGRHIPATKIQPESVNDAKTYVWDRRCHKTPSTASTS